MQTILKFGTPLEYDGYHYKDFTDLYDDPWLQQEVIQQFLDDLEAEIEKSYEFLHFKKNLNVFIY